MEPIGEAYKIVFGDTNDAGYITFFDALYVPETGYQKQPLHPDVITVHHPKYYQGTTPPADWDSPTPIQFLSATGSYLIALAAPELEEEKKWINATFKILEEALKIMGIGAKTSSGYGRMEVEQTSVPTERIHLPIPNFSVGQDITGSVVAATDDLRRRTHSEAKAFLRYQSFALKDVLMIVSAEEAQNWKPGETRICKFVREEELEGCTVLLCQPRPQKSKDKDKKKR